MRRSILKDTLLLTAMQMALDAAGIWVNVRLNRTLGTASVGVLTLSASVFRLICKGIPVQVQSLRSLIQSLMSRIRCLRRLMKALNRHSVMRILPR